MNMYRMTFILYLRADWGSFFKYRVTLCIPTWPGIYYAGIQVGYEFTAIIHLPPYLPIAGIKGVPTCLVVV